MRRAAVVLVLLVAACGGGSDESTAGGGPEEALKAFTMAAARGQYSRAYERIHPDQREILDLGQFEACMKSFGPTVLLEDFEVVDRYDDSVTFPGVDGEQDAVALTWEATVSGERGTSTNHVVEVDGEWFTYMNAEGLANCA